MPSGGGIDLPHYCCDGAAAPDGDSQVVHCVFVGCALEDIKLLQNALHPMRETPMLRGGPGNGINSGHLTSLEPFGTAGGIAARPNGIR